MSENILVTGARRSGTTFLGRVLTFDKSISYIHEPFNCEEGINDLGINNWYPIFSKTDLNAEQKEVLNNLFNLSKIRFKVSLGDGKTSRFKYDARKIEIIKNVFTNYYTEPLYNRIGKAIIGSRFKESYIKAKLNPYRKKILIKDPLAALISNFLAQEYNLKVVAVIRHPAAYYHSMKKRGWGVIPQIYKQNHGSQFLPYINVKKLEEELLPEVNEQFSKAIIEWICVNVVLLNYVKNNKKFILVFHEDLSLKPIKTIQMLCEELDIAFNDKMKQRIIDYTNNGEVDSKKVSNIKRNASVLVSSWKDYLSSKEVHVIKKTTSFLTDNLYSDNYW